MSVSRREDVQAHPHTFTVLFEPAEEGGYVVTCPALPPVVTQGETIEEARAMAEDAIRCYLEYLRDEGLRIPQDLEFVGQPIREKVEVALRPR